MRASILASVFAMLVSHLAGCASSPPPAPLAPDPPEPAIEGDGPIVPSADELPGDADLPRSIRRLVAEQQEEVRSIAALADELRDRHGRARALEEARALRDELSDIEASLGASDSEALDAVVVRLHRLATRTALVREALQQAVL